MKLTEALLATEQAILMIDKSVSAISDRSALHAKSLVEIEKRLGNIRLDMSKLTRAVDDAVIAVQIATGATVNAKDRVNRAAENLDQTGKILLQRREPEVLVETFTKNGTPRFWRLVWVNFADLSWKHRAKLIVPCLVAGGAWVKATPSIIEAVKLLILGIG